ncbi:hypothetical protein A2U01_0104376 [Trifolium medium]|uniref:Uncharacterized protein n=1 Tax=Trifolium medium TaxID=97028 RepID=A0A392V842_9FABA|nr:hypothetical protein [Trifolium medium]
MIGKGRVKTAANPMITEEKVMVVVKGSRVLEIVTNVENGVICHMIARRKVTSVLVVVSLGIRPMLVV